MADIAGPVATRVLAVAALLLPLACATPIETATVFVVDGASLQPPTEPLDLWSSAMSQGCTYVSMPPWVLARLTIEDVVTPTEYVVRGRYGLERVRPRLPGSTTGRLQQLASDEIDVVARLRTELVGRQLLEPSDDLSPVAASDGLRLVKLVTPDGEPFHELLDEILDELRDLEPEAVSGGPIDLARVPRDDESLASRFAAAVALAESASDFRASALLTAEWASFADPPELSPALRDAWRQYSDSCVEGVESLDEPFTGSIGLSLPGGRIYLDSDHEWCEFELHYALVHELMHQHQYALCASGALADRLPGILREAHASSLAREILRKSGADAAAIDFTVAWDSHSAAAQAFDGLRAERGFTPDECLLYLAAHADVAEELQRRIEFRSGNYVFVECESPTDDGPLEFTFVGRSARGKAIVAVVNRSERPFSGFANGRWRCSTSTREDRCGGGTPFTLRLPAQGRVVLETQVDLDAGESVQACAAVYRETPAPVFDS